VVMPEERAYHGRCCMDPCGRPSSCWLGCCSIRSCNQCDAADASDGWRPRGSFDALGGVQFRRRRKYPHANSTAAATATDNPTLRPISKPTVCVDLSCAALSKSGISATPEALDDAVAVGISVLEALVASWVAWVLLDAVTLDEGLAESVEFCRSWKSTLSTEQFAQLASCPLRSWK